MAGGVLDVPERDAGVEGEGHEGMAQAEPVGAVKPSGSGQAPHHTEGGRLVEASTAGGDRQGASLLPGQVVVDRPGRDRE
jgi:hypothetical protein